MLFSDSVGGADDSRNGFSNLMPVNVTARLGILISSPRGVRRVGSGPHALQIKDSVSRCRRSRRQLIQFTPASLFHFVVIFFACVQSSIEPRPVMSPTPNLESFQPPNENGSRGTGTPTFTPTIPAFARSIT